MSKILVLNSFVFINKIEVGILLYNTVNGEYVVIVDNLLISLFEGVKIGESQNYFLIILDKYMSNELFVKMITEIESKNIGELIELDINKRPLLFSPFLNIDQQNIYDYLDNFRLVKVPNNETRERENFAGKNLVSNLRELTIHFNSTSEISDKYKNLFKQYPFPYVDKYQEIDINLLLSYLDVRIESEVRCNLIIGVINNDNIHKVNCLIAVLKSKYQLYIYTLVNNINYIDKLDIDQKYIYTWIFGNQHVSQRCKNMIGIFVNSDEKIYFESSENDICVDYFPAFTGDNLNFCIEILKFNISEVTENKLTERELYCNKFINSNFFGELTILPSGEIYSCISKSSIDDISSLSLKKTIYKELTETKNWLFVRNDVNPCKNCIYNILCPPITNLEISTNKFDLCIK